MVQKILFIKYLLNLKKVYLLAPWPKILFFLPPLIRLASKKEKAVIFRMTKNRIKGTTRKLP
jgi:hypothetical protein